MNRFFASDPERTVDTLDERTLVLFCKRARIGLWVMIASLGVFIVADLVAGRPGLVFQIGLKVAQLPVAAGALWSFDTARGRRYARGTVLAVLAMNAVALAPIGIARADAATGPVLLTMATLSAGFMLPWGAVRQGVYAAVATAASWSLTLAVEPWSTAAIYPALARTVLYVGSIIVAQLAERNRAERGRMEAALREGTSSLIEANTELHEEGLANAALLHVTATLQCHLRDPDMLRRVNGLAVETLGCDWSSTFLWDSRRGGLVLHATAGARPEVAAELATLVFPVPRTAHDVFDSFETCWAMPASSRRKVRSR